MYGMTKKTRELTLKKIENQKTYMYTHGIKVDENTVPFATFVKNSFMNSNRYIAEINHRVASIHEYATKRGLANVFLTLTLPSEYHRYKKIPNGKMAKNPKYLGNTYIADIKLPMHEHAHVPAPQVMTRPQSFKIVNPDYDKYQPRGASKVLTAMLKKLFDLRVYRNIPKDDRLYFRVTEPHHDGTPHLHISFYMPKENVEGFLDGVGRLYPFPQSEVSSNHIPEAYTHYDNCLKSKKKVQSGYKKSADDVNFIRTHIDSPIAYLMKYVLKTLDDLRDDENDFTDITLWYLYHGISRIYTSRTFIDLATYRLFKGRFSLVQLTDEYRQGNITVLLNTETKKIEQVYDEFGIVYVRQAFDIVSGDELFGIIPQYGETPSNWTNREDRTPTPIDVYIDDEHYSLYDGDLIPDGFHPYELNDMALMRLYIRMEVIEGDYLNNQQFVNIQNICVERGLIDGSISSYTEMMESF